jgi:hypothetical protein
VDRAECWSVALVLAALVAAIPVAIDVARAVESAESRTIAVEATTRHPVEAVALAPSEVRTREPATSHQADVQWFDQSAKRTRVAKVPHPVRTGDRIRLWVNDNGDLTSAPRDTGDALASGVGAGLMFWLSMAVLAHGILCVLHRLIDRRRYRTWDRDLRILVGYGGGSTAHDAHG